MDKLWGVNVDNKKTAYKIFDLKKLGILLHRLCKKMNNFKINYVTQY